MSALPPKEHPARLTPPHPLQNSQFSATDALADALALINALAPPAARQGGGAAAVGICAVVQDAMDMGEPRACWARFAHMTRMRAMQPPAALACWRVHRLLRLSEHGHDLHPPTFTHSPAPLVRSDAWAAAVHHMITTTRVTDGGAGVWASSAASSVARPCQCCPVTCGLMHALSSSVLSPTEGALPPWPAPQHTALLHRVAHSHPLSRHRRASAADPRRRRPVAQGAGQGDARPAEARR